MIWRVLDQDLGKQVLLQRSCMWQAQGAHQMHDMRRYLWVQDAIAAARHEHGLADPGPHALHA